MGGIDLSSWFGKPPDGPKPPSEPANSTEQSHSEDPASDPAEVEDEDAEMSDAYATDNAARFLALEESSDDGHSIHDDQNAAEAKRNAYLTTATDIASAEHSDDSEDVSAALGLFQKHFYIEIPKISEEEKQKYEYLPGHFSVKRVLHQQRDKRYVVELRSGEHNTVSFTTASFNFTSLSRSPERNLRSLCRLSCFLLGDRTPLTNITLPFFDLSPSYFLPSTISQPLLFH
jgi:hypothetical protein